MKKNHLGNKRNHFVPKTIVLWLPVMSVMSVMFGTLAGSMKPIQAQEWLLYFGPKATSQSFDDCTDVIPIIINNPEPIQYLIVGIAVDSRDGLTTFNFPAEWAHSRPGILDAYSAATKCPRDFSRLFGGNIATTRLTPIAIYWGSALLDQGFPRSPLIVFPSILGFHGPGFFITLPVAQEPRVPCVPPGVNEILRIQLGPTAEPPDQNPNDCIIKFLNPNPNLLYGSRVTLSVRKRSQVDYR